ncbi:TolC family protein [Aequorivita viscosa]|uniref:Outer membrane protein TolC n=1 Tax=Aequorivita viscosa TaxID=797419 RepID=A0A1M6EAN8_9FLAO|nr:TolC family protein [Aequorivita viscosa]SDW00670.1 Outer membrane protein TolC [Aequorivita viscosa]SHI82564.1 Outer membrane protein TolC [Aequorivita viscosa]
MKKLLFILFAIAPILAFSQETLTLEACYDLAEKNYPLAKQKALLEEKLNSEIRVLEKEKLPKIDLNAQATYQSDVIEFPLTLPNTNIESPNKDQYRASIDANQLIYNGGNIAANTRLKTAELATQQQQVAVNLYTLKSRINQSYFSVLLFQEQKNLLLSKMKELETRLNEVKIGVKYGAVLPASEQVLTAEQLKLEQQISQTSFDRKKALNNLASLLSQNLDTKTILTTPEILIAPEIESNRPELELFDLQETQLETSKEVISKSNYPKIFGFAQAGYGNPGLNMLDNSFQDFYMVGLKLNWNVFDWGKTKEKKQAIDISKEIVSTEKETFVLNNEIQLKEAESDIKKYEAMLLKDIEIIELREQVLQVSTSQLQNGVITSSEYITELNNLYEAKIDQQVHKIQLSLAKANYKVIKGE